jgi:diguanylate cyclase (GGDEF)-like protein
MHLFCGEYFTNKKEYDQAFQHFANSNTFLLGKWEEYIEIMSLLQNYIDDADYIRIREKLNNKMTEILFDYNLHYTYLINSLKNAYDELKALNTINHDLALLDSLTGLHNRRYLYEKFEELVNKAIQENVSIACLLIDLDDFKDVNDKYGHLQGDVVLKRTCDIIKDSLKQLDIVVRYGGDEILILLYDVEKENAKKIADKLRKSIESKIILKYDEDTVKMTISVGISFAGQEKLTDLNLMDKLVSEADKSLYKAKSTGKNRIEIL